MATLYLRRAVVESLSNPKKFAKEAYVLSVLGYIVSTPLGFSDYTSPLPTEEQLEAEEFCSREKEGLKELIPYVYYLPYSLSPDLCNCLEEEVTHLLLCDTFTQEVLLSYILDYIYEQENFPPTYRLLETVFFCSGRPKMIKEKVEPFPSLNVQSMTLLLEQIFSTASFLWRNLRFVATLSLQDITYKAPYFRLTPPSNASVILKGEREGLYLISTWKNKPSNIYLGETTYYYYSPEGRNPGSWTFYSFLFSLLSSSSSLRELFFATPLAKDLWEKTLFFPGDNKVVLERVEKNLPLQEITKGVKLKCALNLLSS